FAADLEIVARSAPMPRTLLCTVGGRLQPWRSEAMVHGLEKLHTDPERAEILRTMRMTRFEPVDTVALDAARGLFALARRRAATADDAPIEALLGAVRADVWLTDHESDPEARGRAAAAAVEAAQWCARRRPAEPACDYWLGAALGVQARERPATGLSALPEI